MKEFLGKIDDEKLTELKDSPVLISDLFIDCNTFEPDSTLREDCELSEDELENCLKKPLLEIQYRYLSLSLRFQQ